MITHDWLQTTAQAQILHAFDQVVNLINDRGMVLSICSTEIGKGPFSVIVSGMAQDWTPQITSGTAAEVADSAIRIGEVIIDLSMASMWNARPHWNRLRRSGISAFDLGWQIEPHQTIKSVVSNFRDAFLTNDSNALTEAAGHLMGRGPGVTPAGDDYLLGAIYGCWATGFPLTTAKWVQTMATNARSQTTALSAAWLQAAINGFAHEYWHRLVMAILLNDKQALNRAQKAIVSTGATSGQMGLCGFLDMLEDRRIHDISYRNQ